MYERQAHGLLPLDVVCSFVPKMKNPNESLVFFKLQCLLFLFSNNDFFVKSESSGRSVLVTNLIKVPNDPNKRGDRRAWRATLADHGKGY